MWIALLDFCLFLLLFSFLLYGLLEWDNLLTDSDDGSSGFSPQADLSGRFFSLWILIFGLGGLSLIFEVLEWLKS